MTFAKRKTPTFGAKINKSFIKRHCQINLDSFVHFSARKKITCASETIQSHRSNGILANHPENSTFHVALAALCSLLVQRKIISFSGKHSNV